MIVKIISDVLKRAAERAEQRAQYGAHSEITTGCVIRSPEAVVAGRSAQLWRECLNDLADLRKESSNVQG